jgi:lysophospholipase L1-like esterase
MEKMRTSKTPRDILFYGDSLTWGMAHNYTGRYVETYPRMLEQRLLEGGWKIVEAALCSRTSCFDDDSNLGWMIGGEPHIFNGLRHFPSAFLAQSCRAVVILIGTNDLRTVNRGKAKQRTRVDASTIASNVARIGHLARKLHQESPHLSGYPFDVIFVSPPQVRLNPLAQQLGYDDSSMKISLDFPQAFEEMCRVNNFLYVPPPNIDMSKSVDGVHLTPEGTRQLAEAVWGVLYPLLFSHNGNNIGNNVSSSSSSSWFGQNSTSFSTIPSTSSLVPLSKDRKRTSFTTTATTTTTTVTDSLAKRIKPSHNFKIPKLQDLVQTNCVRCRQLRRREISNVRWKMCSDGFWSTKTDTWKFSCNGKALEPTTSNGSRNTNNNNNNLDGSSSVSSSSSSSSTYNSDSGISAGGRGASVFRPTSNNGNNVMNNKKNNISTSSSSTNVIRGSSKSSSNNNNGVTVGGGGGYYR